MNWLKEQKDNGNISLQELGETFPIIFRHHNIEITITNLKNIQPHEN